MTNLMLPFIAPFSAVCMHEVATRVLEPIRGLSLDASPDSTAYSVEPEVGLSR